jgi:hypothetical protein
MCKKLICLVSFVSGLVAMPLVTHAQVVNLMHTDPSFEDEIIIVSPGWTSWTTYGDGGSVEIDATEFIDGGKSLRVNQTSGQFNVIAAAIPLTPGDRYTCSFWAKADAPRPISVRFQSMNNSGFVAGNFDLTTEWAEYTFTEEAPNPNNDIKLQFITNDDLGISYWLDFVFCYAGEYVAGIDPLGLSRVKAADPDPADGAVDVPREAVLNWTPGEYANTHDVYFGTVFDDVNDADRDNPLGALAGRDQIAATYLPERLDLGQTYYWRIDEVNAPPNSTIFKGNVWSFTAEPIGYPIENITATASSVNGTEEGPENTINGSGLDDDNLHSSEGTAMWLSSMTGAQPAWIQYEFDRVHKLYQMWVWNYNSTVEPAVGFGIKEAIIEYSVDGTDWSILGATHEFAQGPGASGYASNTTVDLDGVAAKYVKITANSSWGGWLPQFGLSEVRFLYLPVWAREPSPDSEVTDADVNAILSFRAGREAAEHDLYLSTDEQAVIDGTAPVVTVTEPSYASSLDLAGTYYWRIDEVNDTETPSIWQGGIWSLSTQEYLVVDDFESYNDIAAGEEGSNLVYLTWIDGFDDPTTNGSAMGYTVPFEPTMETSTVYDGSQSVPLSYDNTVATYSEVTANVADLQAGQDWTRHGIKALTLRFFGDPTNVVQQMYVKFNGTKVTYDGSTDDTRLAGWQMWYIDLASTGVSLSNVTELAIGFERIGAAGGQGMVLLDNIRLYSYDRQLITPTDPGTAGLQAHYEFEGTTNDSSGNARNGAAQGNPTFVAGRIGQAISFDGLSDYVEITGYKGILGPNPFSITAWINTSDDECTIMGWGSTAGGTTRVEFRIDQDRLRCESSGNVQGDTTLPDNEWVHVAVTVTAGAMINDPDVTLYLNGQGDNRASTGSNNPLNMAAGYDVTIGRRHTDESRWLIGQIDEVRIYDRALTQEEVTWLAGRIEPFDKSF